MLRSWARFLQNDYLKTGLLQTSFFKKPQLSAYLSASHIAIGNNLNNLLENLISVNLLSLKSNLVKLSGK